MMRGTLTMAAVLCCVCALVGVEKPRPTPPLPRTADTSKEQAMSLRPLGKPMPGRAPVTDPTRDFSTELSLRGRMPERSRRAPYVPVSLPDPFERWRTVKLPSTPGENPNPATTYLPFPKR
jgi:hypothetical protein